MAHDDGVELPASGDGLDRRGWVASRVEHRLGLDATRTQGGDGFVEVLGTAAGTRTDRSQWIGSG